MLAAGNRWVSAFSSAVGAAASADQATGGDPIEAIETTRARYAFRALIATPPARARDRSDSAQPRDRSAARPPGPHETPSPYSRRRGPRQPSRGPGLYAGRGGRDQRGSSARVPPVPFLSVS